MKKPDDTKKWAAPARNTAPNPSHLPVYRSRPRRSSGCPRERLGQLLMALQAPLPADRQRWLWARFEALLRRYYETADLLPVRVGRHDGQ